MKKQVYIGGHMLGFGAQLQRNEEQKMVHHYGHDVFNPANADHNQKATTDQEGLADRIVRVDNEMMAWSNFAMIEPLPEAQGTVCELGIFKGRRDFANAVQDAIEKGATLEQLSALCKHEQERKVMPHYQDIRRVPGITEAEDRRSLGINAFVYGVVLELTDGHGFYTYEQISEALQEGTSEPLYTIPQSN